VGKEGENQIEERDASHGAQLKCHCELFMALQFVLCQIFIIVRFQIF
jgi:flagellar biogenesis protein FliO